MCATDCPGTSSVVLLWAEVARFTLHKRNADAFLEIFVALSHPLSLLTVS